MEQRRGVGEWIGGHLGQLDASGQAPLQLKEERRVQRARLMTARVERGDDQVATCDAPVVERLAVLIHEGEGRHGDELSGQLSEPEVEVVVAGVDRAGNHSTLVEADEHRLDLAGRTVTSVGTWLLPTSTPS